MPLCWGELQRFVDLSLIYAKLFFRLRLVCQEWNRLASDRQYLELNFKPPISNLYFVVARRAGHGLWTSQDSSWTSSPLPPRQCEVSGLLYEASDRHLVFDLHTRMFYSLPHLSSGKPMDYGSVVGMTVDTSLIPYGFRIFTGEARRSNVYDSNSGAWTTSTSSHVLLDLRMSAILSTISNIQYEKGSVFIG